MLLTMTLNNSLHFNETTRTIFVKRFFHSELKRIEKSISAASLTTFLSYVFVQLVDLKHLEFFLRTDRQTDKPTYRSSFQELKNFWDYLRFHH